MRFINFVFILVFFDLFGLLKLVVLNICGVGEWLNFVLVVEGIWVDYLIVF